MKKFLILFVILDLVFIGVVLRIFSEKERSIASIEQESNLTAGQKQKLELIKSFYFSANKDEFVLSTDFLQSLCTTYDRVELKFKAIGMAFSGQPPMISNTFACNEVLKNPDQINLRTSSADFKFLQKNAVVSKTESQLKAFSIYSDEEFPQEWRLFEIGVTGDVSFNITEAEINTVLGAEAFKFNLSTF